MTLSLRKEDTMRIEYDDDYREDTPKEYPYPVNGGNVERLAWEENHARCVWHNSYPISGGRLEKLAWERAHGWE